MCKSQWFKEGFVNERKKGERAGKPGAGYDAECDGNFIKTAHTNRRTEKNSGGASLGASGWI